MGRIAVDVVLLPSEAVMDKAIEANRYLVEKFGEEIVLDKENCLPHISLAMGCIDEKDIGAIEKILWAITDESSLGDLRAVGVCVAVNAVGQRVSALEIARTERLQSLHERVMREVGPYFAGEVAEDMIYGEQKVAESTLLWIRDYRSKSGFAKFRPHITLGYGRIENWNGPSKLAVSRLALCHLGNHCTCRRILVSVEGI